MRSTRKPEATTAPLPATKAGLSAREVARLRCARLTTREKEVLRWLVRRGTIAQIAKRNRMAAGTLRKHIDNLRDKTGRRTRAELAVLGMVVELTDERDEKDT